MKPASQEEDRRIRSSSGDTGVTRYISSPRLKAFVEGKVDEKQSKRISRLGKGMHVFMESRI